MASNKRKKTFPKPPVRFHSQLAKELGKYSNKNGFEATLKGIYYAPEKLQDNKLTKNQEKALEKLRRNCAKKLEGTNQG